MTREEVYALRRAAKAAAPRRQKYGNERVELDALNNTIRRLTETWGA